MLRVFNMDLVLQPQQFGMETSLWQNRQLFFCPLLQTNTVFFNSQIYENYIISCDSFWVSM